MSEHTTPTSSELAVERTRLAHERTLMAWIRTAFSMISFGFTIIKFFEYLGQSQTIKMEHPMIGARNLGATMIIMGTVSLVGATWQYWRMIRRARAAEGGPRFPMVLIVAVLLCAIGLLAFVGAFVHTGLF